MIVSVGVDQPAFVDSVAMTGRFVVADDGSIVPDDDARRLLHKQQSMRILAYSGRAPEFFYDPTDGAYWEFLHFEDGQLTFRRVERAYIEANWPNVNPDLKRPGQLADSVLTVAPDVRVSCGVGRLFGAPSTVRAWRQARSGTWCPKERGSERRGHRHGHSRS